jgi:hypothetical protein
LSGKAQEVVLRTPHWVSGVETGLSGGDVLREAGEGRKVGQCLGGHFITVGSDFLVEAAFHCILGMGLVSKPCRFVGELCSGLSAGSAWGFRLLLGLIEHEMDGKNHFVGLVIVIGAAGEDVKEGSGVVMIVTV